MYMYKSYPKALMGERQNEQSYLQNFGLVCVSIHVCVRLTQCEYMYGYLWVCDVECVSLSVRLWVCVCVTLLCREAPPLFVSTPVDGGV